jgi:hypothetical protein
VFFGTLVAVAAAGCATYPPAPVEQLAVARAAVDDAMSAGGAQFAPIALRNARDKLDRANAAMAAHDYLGARYYAEAAESDARLAATSARSQKAERAAGEVDASIRALREEAARAAAR